MLQSLILFFQQSIDLVIPVCVLLVTVLAGYLLRRILFSRLSHWASKSSTQIDDIIISAAKKPFMIWCLMLGIYFALEISKLPDVAVRIAEKIILVLGIISAVLVLADVAVKSINVYSGKAATALPVTSLTRNIARVVIFSIGILIVLNSLGISITPILAALGVGGLAVALALQDTLSNFFAGFHITIARQVRLGDYVKLETGEEGYVVDINWRATKIKMLSNNVVLIPNDKLTKTVITNYCLPDKEVVVTINLGVHYDSDLNKVEKVTCEVAKEVMKEVPGGIPNFEPVVRYHSLGDFSVIFTVVLRAREFVDQYLIKHEFIKRLHERYKQEGIVIPYPTRTINCHQAKE